MPTPTPPTFVNGDVMVAADVEAAITDARDYLNGQIVNSDVTDGEIGVESLARPSISNLTTSDVRFEGTFGGVAARMGGIGDEPAPQNERAGAGASSRLSKERLRRPIYPALLENGDAQPVEGTGVRFDVFGPLGSAEVVCTVKLEVVNGGANAERCGQVALFYRNVDADPGGAGTEIAGTRRIIYWLQLSRQLTHFLVCGSFPVYQGAWDVWLAYSPGAVTSATKQIIVTGPVTVVEVHEGVV